ncbi:MAG: DNA recombination protein RmuC [Hyphomonadaceae bacterium]
MLIDPLHIVLLVLLLAAIAAAVWMRQGAAPRIAALEAELQREREERAADARDFEAGRNALSLERDELRDRAQIAERRLEAQDAILKEREAAVARERERMEKMQAEAEQRFKSLAQNALVESQKRFVELADETFKKHQEGAKGDLGAMLKPIQETFGQFREKVDAIEKTRAEDRAKLDEQLRNVGETARMTHEVTGKLASALAAPRHGGRWGEETLRNVLEMSGLSPYADFVEQASSDTEKGRIRPDVIVRMPGGRELVIDSKVSLDDYLAASSETDAQKRSERLRAHAARVRAHVTALSRKDYWKDLSERVDFVAMFIPGENFYAAVLEEDREIFDFAAKNNVIIVTPSTLIALAKAVAYGWRQEQASRNAEQAVGLGRELYARLVKMCEHMGKVGSSLDKAVGSYNDMVGSFERKVMPQVRRFEELQIPTDGQSVDAPGELTNRARALQITEGQAVQGKPVEDKAADKSPGLFEMADGGKPRRGK